MPALPVQIPLSCLARMFNSFCLMVHSNQLRGLVVFCWQVWCAFLPQGGPLIWDLKLLLGTVHSILVLFFKCMFSGLTHTYIASPMLWIALYHTHTAYLFPTVYQNTTTTMFHYFQPSHTPLCVKDSYSWTHTVNNFSHKSNMPQSVWFSFYLFKSYHHHM